jgi:hypothetical protein
MSNWHIATARCLLTAGPAAQVLRILQLYGERSLPLFADFLISRLPLAESEWALLFTPCPGLGAPCPPR